VDVTDTDGYAAQALIWEFLPTTESDKAWVWDAPEDEWSWVVGEIACYDWETMTGGDGGASAKGYAGEARLYPGDWVCVPKKLADGTIDLAALGPVYECNDWRGDGVQCMDPENDPRAFGMAWADPEAEVVEVVFSEEEMLDAYYGYDQEVWYATGLSATKLLTETDLWAAELPEVECYPWAAGLTYLAGDVVCDPFLSGFVAWRCTDGPLCTARPATLEMCSELSADTMGGNDDAMLGGWDWDQIALDEIDAQQDADDAAELALLEAEAEAAGTELVVELPPYAEGTDCCDLYTEDECLELAAGDAEGGHECAFDEVPCNDNWADLTEAWEYLDGAVVDITVRSDAPWEVTSLADLGLDAPIACTEWIDRVAAGGLDPLDGGLVCDEGLLFECLEWESYPMLAQGAAYTWI